MNQELVSVVTAENRCLVFPSTYQQRVAPFEPEDRSRCSHRKILPFFLVDLDKQVVSTKHARP